MPVHAAENGGVRGTVPFDLVERYAVLREDRGICDSHYSLFAYCDGVTPLTLRKARTKPV